MRNVFAQFKQPENQLSHALATTLSVNPKLCRRFVAWVTGESHATNTRFSVAQQTIPGTPTEDAAPEDQDGLPDICIHNGDWCLAIECKVAAALTAHQLHRHRRTVERSFGSVVLAAITAEHKPRGLARGVHHRTWEDVYRWMGTALPLDPFWCRQLRDYMRGLESRLLAEAYPILGSLSTFDGIPFCEEHPYSYREAKLLLKQAMPLLRMRRNLRKLGTDPYCTGRPAITGRKGSVVWDFISLRPAGEEGGFTSWPHLTLSIHAGMTETYLTIPNGLKGRCRKDLRNLGSDGFLDLCKQIAKEARNNFGSHAGYQPTLRIVQRHFHGQRRSVEDGFLRVDLRTAAGSPRRNILPQPHWFSAAYALITDKNRTNTQLQIGLCFPHADGLLQKRGALETIETGWVTCRPAVQLLMA